MIMSFDWENEILCHQNQVFPCSLLSRTNVLFSFFRCSNKLVCSLHVYSIHVYILTNITPLFQSHPCGVETNCVSSLHCSWPCSTEGVQAQYRKSRQHGRPSLCLATVGHSPMGFIPRGRLTLNSTQGLTLVVTCCNYG